ncbi:RNA ligase 1 isoform X2 [Pseudophryne corroboree]|uniref:RNA ligase 1 isoform X2 n=1 Tax=Pseudophryne corroboree TaxID=495146 RepID=UPI0030814CD0
MQWTGAVQQKVPCVFLTRVKDEPSSKREHQMFKVIATETLNPVALNADIHNAIPTEKVDGTCCYVALHKDFIWNVDDDFKSVPEFWIPAKGVKQSNGKPYPDENGHIPGWVPVENGNKQYCWHSSAVNYELGVGIILKRHPEDPGALLIYLGYLCELLEQTLELIGTNINGNPYGIGNKKNPIHLLVPHGTLLICDLPALDHKSLISWFDHRQEGKVEGIVWHCKDRSLIKLHRHHLGLGWPLTDTYLSSKPVSISMDLCKFEYEAAPSSLLRKLSKKDYQQFDSLKDIVLD